MKVLLSLAPPERGATRFVDHIVEGVDKDVDIRFFRWKDALRGDFDVFHLHWPERLVRRGVLRTLALLMVLKLRSVPIVRTLHNVRPHEPGHRFENLLLDLIDRRTELFVRLNEFTDVPYGKRTVLIPHPHYIDRLPVGREPVDSGRILYFGIIRPYKGVDALLQAFAQATADRIALRFVGSAKGDRGDSIRAAQASDARITSDLSYVPDDQLAREIQRAEIVVLPHRGMHNSGSVLLALSAGTPVLVPRTAANEALSAEVGAGWLYLYDGDLSGEDLDEALRSVRAEERGAPDLSRRGWTVVGRSLSEAYRTAVTMSRARPWLRR